MTDRADLVADALRRSPRHGGMRLVSDRRDRALRDAATAAALRAYLRVKGPSAAREVDVRL